MMKPADEEFYRRLTLPEERKDRLASPWCGSFRWFASYNVVKLENYSVTPRPSEIV
jgi:hypothetical protein